MKGNKLLLCVSYIGLAALADGQTKISELPAMSGADAATTDVVPIVDVSAGLAGSKKITLAELFSTPVTWNGNLITAAKGGTGVNNSGKTITLGGNLATSGANPLTLTTTGATNVTLPTSGTLATQAAVDRKVDLDDAGTLRGLRNLMQLPDGNLQTNVICIGDSFNMGAYNGLEAGTIIRGAFKSGVATGGGDSGVTETTNDYSRSPDGKYWTIASGGNLTCGWLQSGHPAAVDTAHYTFFPGTGTAQLQYSLGGGAWTNFGTAIDTTAITTVQIGDVSLPLGYRPNYRIRVTATGGTVNGWLGMSQNQNAGVRLINFSLTGQDIGQSTSITEAIWKAMVTGYGADLVMTTFADHRFTSVAGTFAKGSESWADGGPMDTLRSWSKAVKPAIDWLVVGAHPVDPAISDRVDAVVDPLYAALGIDRNTHTRVKDGAEQSRAWALRKGEGYFDAHSLFPDYLEALGAGLYPISTPVVSGISRSGDTVSVTYSGSHGLLVGDVRSARLSGITGYTGTNPNGRWLMTASSSTVLQYTVPGAGGTYGGSVMCIMEDGVHLTAVGSRIKFQALMERTNLGVLLSNQTRRAGDAMLSAVRPIAGLPALTAYVYDPNTTPQPAALMGAQLRVPMAGDVTQGMMLRCPSGSEAYLSTFDSGGETVRFHFYGPDFLPANNNAGTLGSAGKRWANAYFTTLNLPLGSVPASATATGTQGEIRVDANYIYICIATNSWKRTAISSW